MLLRPDPDAFMLKCFLFVAQWYTLSDVKSGRIHLVLEWVPTSSEPDRLDQVSVVKSSKRLLNRLMRCLCFLLKAQFLLVSLGSSVLRQTVLPKQGGAISRSTVCVCGTGRWLTCESFDTIMGRICC